MKNFLILLAAVICYGMPAAAQDSILHVPVQITFVTPLGTNGLNSGRTINQLSLNMVYGYHCGLEGMEFSGFMSTLKGTMKGAQFAGFSNVVLDTVLGCQFAGFYNHAAKQVRGIQAAGFLNNALADAEAVQFAGFGNLVAGDLNGGQFSGFGNIATGKLWGIQAAGFGNIANGDVDGMQAAGFGNLAKGNLLGAQISGFSNVVTGDAMGMQVAGFSNTVRGSMKGMQVAGFVNYAHRIIGSQFGFINLADTMDEGVAIGFLSFVKNGYHKIEISTNEALQGVVSFKTGTDRFYNILSAGATAEHNDYIMWGFGYGLGTIVPIGQHWGLNIEALCYHINQDEWFTDDLNLLNKANFNLMWRPGRFEMFAGPSFNVMVTDRIDGEGDPLKPNVMPDLKFYEYHGWDTYVRLYPGFNFGVRL